ncbi:chromosome segregation ATPase [Xanthomonas sp. F14]
MARGIQENAVFEAADALLGAGERPTVERVRLHLGRGSPNTIGPLLDAWWTQLSQRLKHRLALPGVPDNVGVALAQVWELALAAGRGQAEAALAPERVLLANAQADIETRVSTERERVTAIETQRQQALAAAQVAEAALSVCEQRAGDLASQVGALLQQLEELRGRSDSLEAQVHSAQSRLEQERNAAAAERETLQTHLRQVEDRAYTEIDRLRQEAKAHKAQLATQAREHAAALRDAEQARRAAERAQHSAERESAAAQARAQALAQPRPTKAPTAVKKMVASTTRRVTKR